MLLALLKTRTGMPFSFPMRNNDMRLPEVEKVSKLIDALSDFAVNSARGQWEGCPREVYCAPDLASWDDFSWFELAQDWKVVDFLLSDRWEACRLMRSLQSLLQWYGQTELDEIVEQKRLLSIFN